MNIIYIKKRIKKLLKSLFFATGSADAEFGDGYTSYYTVITEIGSETDPNWATVQGQGSDFQNVNTTGAVKSDGTAWVWGQNTNYRLGLDDTIDRYLPTQLGTDTNWENIEIGNNYSIGLKTNGTLWFWGSSTDYTVPTQVGSDTDWDFVSAGEGHACAIKDDGTIYFVGFNDGRFGDGFKSYLASLTDLSSTFPSTVKVLSSNRTSFSSFTSRLTALISEDGKLYISGYFAEQYYWQYTQVGSDTDWEYVELASADRILLLKDDNTLWCMGSNPDSTPLGLGNNTNSPITTPTQIGTDTDWAKISISHSHCMGIKTDGTLWAWGSNNNGQLGLGDTTNRTSPVQVGSGTDWEYVSSGYYFTMAIKTDGTLWAAGSNGNGQFGRGNTTSSTSFVQIGSGTDWESVTAGTFKCFGIKTDGTLWAAGNNGYVGPLGLGNTTFNITTFTKVGTDTNWSKVISAYDTTIALKTNGTMWAWGNDSLTNLIGGNYQNTTPVQVGTDTDWDDFSSSPRYAFLIKNYTDSQEIYASGSNNAGQLGLPGKGQYDTLTNTMSGSWSKAYFTQNSVVAVKSDGSLWTSGYNYNGALAQGNTNNTYIGFVRENSNSTAWTGQVTMGGNSRLAIKSDGTLWAVGNNNSGQLGLGNTTQRTSYTKVGTDTNWKSVSTNGGSTYATKTNGTLWAWGYNAQGQLGLGNTTNRTSPVQVGSDTDWDSVFTIRNRAYFLKTDGTLWGIGNNDGNYLGIVGGTYSSFSFINSIENIDDWEMISSVGTYSSAGIRKDGTLWAWGSNSNGQLGLGNTTSVSIPTQVGSGTDWKYVFPGYNMMMAIKTDGTLWGTGYQGWHLLGDGTNAQYTSLTQIGTDTNWEKIDGSSQQNMAVKSNGTIWGWGRNSAAWGDSGSTTRSTPTQESGGDTDWVDVSALNNGSIALKSNGTLWSAGSVNNYGQLGHGNTSAYTTYTQIGTDTDWAKISTGEFSCLAIKTDGTLWAWGVNSYGLLGLGDTTNRTSPVQVGSGTDWKYISAGYRNSYAIKTDGTLWAAGFKDGLGTSATVNSDIFIQVGTKNKWKYVSAKKMGYKTFASALSSE